MEGGGAVANMWVAERRAFFISASAVAPPAAPVRSGSLLPVVLGQMGERMDWARAALLSAALVFPIWGMRPLDFVKFGDIKFEYVMILATLTAALAVAESGMSGGFGFRRSMWLWGLGGVVVVSLAASLVATDPVTAVNGSFMRRDGFLMVLANSRCSSSPPIG